MNEMKVEKKAEKAQASLKFLVSMAGMLALSISIIAVLKPLASVENEASQLKAKLEAAGATVELK